MTDAQKVIDTIMRSARRARSATAKSSSHPLREVIRIRTGETSQDAI